jgi:hypothetical protein
MSKRKINNYVFRPGISYNGNLYPNAYTSISNNISYLQAELTAFLNYKIAQDTAVNLLPNAVSLLTNNKAWLAQEVTYWIAYQVSQGNSGFVGYTYDSTKCVRDVGYLIDAWIHDLRYGGNEQTITTISKYWINTTPQILGSRLPEIYAYAFLRDRVNNYIFTRTSPPTIYQSGTGLTLSQTGSNAEGAAGAKITVLAQNTIDVVTNGLTSLPTQITKTAVFENYTYNQAKCTRDLNFVINAYLHDLRYGGNEQTNYTVSFYWNGTTAQVDGDRQPEIQGHTFVYQLISNYIIKNLAATSYQSSIRQVINPALTYETAAGAAINSLGAGLVAVLTNGLGSLPPTVAATNGQLKIQGNYTLNDILLITNTSKGELIYNFANSSQGGVLVTNSSEFADPTTARTGGNFPGNLLTDNDFPSFAQTTDQVTTIQLFYDTSSHSSTDSIQIYVEDKQGLEVRPYRFGTDAIERMRVAAPQSMLDADFEYGLQPTKWQAIGVARGYPSIYEVPGTDQNVQSITSDASAGTSGVGGSLITVTVGSAHGFSVGTPISVKGLNTAIFGFARGEGNFVITSVPTTTSFTYYAKAKVGTSNPTTINTTFTQVRQGGFYTGADIGTPSFTVVSNGATGTINTVLTTAAGRNRFAFTGGTAPSIGSPISGTNIPLGSQITSIVGSGGIIVTPTVTADFNIGATAITVADTTGIVQNVGLNDGSGNIIFVDSVVGNTVNLSDPLTGIITGNTVTYSGVTGTNVTGSGLSATFVITRDQSTAYSVAINAAGSAYATGDTIKILGSALGGVDVTNDLYITVTAIVGSPAAGTISTISFKGTSNAIANQTITPTYTTASAGSSAVFSVTRNVTAYTATITNGGTGYSANDTFTVTGNQFTYGATTANDVTITVTSVTRTYTAVTGTASPAGGSGAQFTVTRTGSAYATPIVTNPGTGYSIADTITILGSALGGVDTTNDLVITVTATSLTGGVTGFTFNTFQAAGTGSIAAITVSGTGNASTTYTLGGANVGSPGTGLTFSITRSSALYSGIVISAGGANYSQYNKITILGTSLGGATPANDLTVVVNSVDGSGSVTTVSQTGTPAAAAGSTVNIYSAVVFSDFATGSIPASTAVTFTALATLRIDFLSNHGLVPGSALIVVPSSDNGSNNHTLAGGSYLVTSVPSPTSIQYFARAAGNITGTIVGKVYARPDTFFVHRPYDGGVQLGTGGPAHGAQAIRMSKKYIRYQSGKGIMYTTGALFAPSYSLQSITATSTEVGATLTVTTDDSDHGLQIGGKVRISGITTPGYNGDYFVDYIISERVFQLIGQYRLGNQVAQLSDDAVVAVLNWHGATVRAGTFDDQNGIFWEYDGSQLYAVQRTSTKQLAGTISIAANSNTVTGTNTRFRDQLKAGDTVVIRGMTHIVSSVTDQFTMSVTPDYRGVNNVVNGKMCAVNEKRVPQSQFNLDRLDGTGPSGYKLDITKMQMIGLQWSWYGAGFIDWMLRGADGNYVFAHRQRNSNVNYEAYMRTGNMPVRYEVHNVGRGSALAADMTTTQTTMVLEDASTYPSTGTVYVDNELIYYSGKTNNTLTGLTRSASLTNFQSGAVRSYTGGLASTHSTRTGVVLVSNTITPLISHWGSAFLTDGRFDEDRGYLFSYTATGVSISTTKVTAFLIRLAPSVSNAVTGDLGDRELINRAQLLLEQIAITSETSSTGGLVIEGILNPQNYPANPGDISWGGLAGLAQGGQPSFAQIAPGGSVNWNGGATTTTATATVIAPITAAIATPAGSAFDRPTGSTFAYVTKTAWDTSGASNGISTSDGKFTTTGTKVTGVAASPTPQAATIPQLIGTSTYAFSNSTNVNYQYFTQASWNALNAQVGYLVNDNNGVYTNGTTITLVQGPFNSSGILYYIVSFSTNSLVATTQGQTLAFKFGGTVTAGNTVLYFTQASWAARPVDTIAGQSTNSAYFAGGTTISTVGSLTSFAGTGFYPVTFSSGALANVNGGTTIVFSGTSYYTLTFNNASTSAISNNSTITFGVSSPSGNTSVIYFTQASWVALGGGTGTTLAASETKFPSNTLVSAVSALQTFNSVNYYQVTFTQSSNTTIGSGATITFAFGNPPYAQPGEKVFSFISVPGISDNLDLSTLKELTVTALGGRGAFPNGPDVLAINIYKTAGTAVNANIILRWSEAQA